MEPEVEHAGGTPQGATQVADAGAALHGLALLAAAPVADAVGATPIPERLPQLRMLWMHLRRGARALVATIITPNPSRRRACRRPAPHHPPRTQVAAAASPELPASRSAGSGGGDDNGAVRRSMDVDEDDEEYHPSQGGNGDDGGGGRRAAASGSASGGATKKARVPAVADQKSSLRRAGARPPSPPSTLRSLLDPPGHTPGLTPGQPALLSAGSLPCTILPPHYPP